MGHIDVRFADKNSERYMLARRVYKIIDILESDYLYPDSEMLGGFSFRDGQYKFSQIDEGEWIPFDSEKDYWGYPECYAWFRHSFKIPERFAGKPVLYQVMPSAQGAWRQVNPQLIFYFNGKLTQGGDSNHQEVRLLECARGGEEFDCCINAHTDAFEFKGPVRMRARLLVIDDLVKRLIFDLKTPLEVASRYTVDDLPRVDIVKALTDAVNLIDFNTSDYDTFAASANAAIELLDREIYSKEAMDAMACCIGHTHIDVAWLWRLRQTREKAGRSFATNSWRNILSTSSCPLRHSSMTLSSRTIPRSMRASKRWSPPVAGKSRAACGLRRTQTSPQANRSCASSLSANAFSRMSSALTTR